jgi:predicted O-methyltransferase YrrM
MDAQPPISHFEQVIDRRDATAWVKNQAFWCMDQMEGWCTQQKASVLIDIILRARPQIIVEIGVWGGKSLIPMAAALKANGLGKIYGIDPWDNAASVQWVMDASNRQFWGTADHQAILRGLRQKIDQFALGDHIELIEKTSEEAPLIQPIDILHVDGNHSDVTSYLDVTKWVPLVRPGGWIIFDDMTWHENGKLTTSRAVAWLDSHCIKIAEVFDICLWGIWIKK